MGPATTAVILLAGGKSSRMGTDKALLQLQGKALIAHAAEAAKQVCNSIILVTNTPEAYSFLGLLCTRDLFDGKGPVDGIYSATQVMAAERFLVLSCDMPFVPPALLNALLEAQQPGELCLPCTDGRLFYFPGVYPARIAASAKELLTRFNANGGIKRTLSMRNLVTGLPVRYYKGESLPLEEAWFRNINTPADLEAAEK